MTDKFDQLVLDLGLPKAETTFDPTIYNAKWQAKGKDCQATYDLISDNISRAGYTPLYGSAHSGIGNVSDPIMDKVFGIDKLGDDIIGLHEASFILEYTTHNLHIETKFIERKNSNDNEATIMVYVELRNQREDNGTCSSDENW